MNKFIFVVFVLYFLNSCNNSREQKKSEFVNNTELKEDYVILDSLRVNDIESLYCFICTDFLGGGEKNYISLSKSVCTISKYKVLAEGNSITGFSHRINNTIYLFGFEKPVIVDNLSRFSFEIRDLTDDKILNIYKQRTYKRVYQYKLCQ